MLQQVVYTVSTYLPKCIELLIPQIRLDICISEHYNRDS